MSGRQVKNLLKYLFRDSIRSIEEENKLRIKKNKEDYLRLVCEKSGWDSVKAKGEMDSATKLGISYYHYVRNECWRKDEAGLIKLADWLKKEKVRKNQNIMSYLEKISADTGWSINKAKVKVQEAQANCGSGYEDYYLFKLYEQDKEEQKEFLTFDVFSKLKLKYNDYRKQDIFNNKVEFNKLFSDCIKRKWFYNKGISYEDFISIVENFDELFAKPLRGTQGKGIVKFHVPEDEAGLKKLYESITQQKAMIMEEYIKQHSSMSKICSGSVNTVRVVTIHKDGKCNLVCAGMRMGNGNIVDNFHAGGMIAAVDINSGVLVTDAVNYDKKVFKKHPISGETIRGFQIPNWDEVIRTCEKISGRVEGINLVGWDFAIVDVGVELIEGNPGPSYVMQQLPYAMDGIGIRKFFEEYI